MRVGAGMREVVGTRATVADCDAHPSNVGADTRARHQTDDEQPPAGTAASRLHIAQLPVSSAHGSPCYLPVSSISPAAANPPVTHSTRWCLCSAAAAVPEGQESKLEKLN